MTGSAIVTRYVDEYGVARAVVTHADDEIAIADELLAEAAKPTLHRIPGALEVDGDLVTFGIPAAGLGRLTYRLIGRDEANHSHIAKREVGPSNEGDQHETH